jgi:hypothetical protein
MSNFYQQRLGRQLFYGPLVSEGIQSTQSPYPEGRAIALLGQPSPSLEARMMAHRGRLAGFDDDEIGNEPPRSDANKWSELATEQLEKDDDVYGSGIFDRPGRMTSNVGDGVFASDYSLPGYVARESPYAVSRDITDVTSGGEVVMIPGGGFYHVEQEGSIQPSPILGPTPRPPRLTVPQPRPVYPGGPTVHDAPYTVTQPESAAQGPLYPNAPVIPAPTLRPPQNLSVNGGSPVPTVWEVTPPAYTRRIMQGKNPFGQTEPEPSKGPTSGQMAVAGILLGITAGLFVSAVREAKRGPR